jgi:transcriptional regulator GlxA family with amidase domain
MHPPPLSGAFRDPPQSRTDVKATLGDGADLIARGVGEALFAHGFVGPEEELHEIAAVTTTLSTVNQISATGPRYRVTVATPGGRPIACSSGVTLQSQHALEWLRGPLDTLVVSGGRGAPGLCEDPYVLGHVRRLARQSGRVASVCTGAWILAAAGLLDGRRATTHWAFSRALAARHPTITVDGDLIYIRDGNVYTAAGVTSALDLTLAFVQEDHGAETARQVARGLVTYLQRPGNQAQMSMFVAPSPAEHNSVRRVVEHVMTPRCRRTSVLAAAVGLSERHLTRLFLADIAQTPSRFVRRARVEAAAHLLASTPLPVPHVAARCGCRSGEALRQAFVAAYGIPPSHYRAAQTEQVAG